MSTYSIVICTYKRASYLRDTLRAVFPLIKGRPGYEVVVIDNNSPDNTKEVVQEFIPEPNFRYYLEMNPGVSHARNRGIKESRNEILIFLDDDVDLEPDFFIKCEELYKDASVEIAGGKLLPYKVKIPDWLPTQYMYLISVFDLGDKPMYTSVLMGANYSMRSYVAQKVGWYNPELGRKSGSLMGGEENDYLFRAQDLGYRLLYAPQLVVYHKIENKLNKEYIYDFSRKNGLSEGLMDAKKDNRHFLSKSFKSMLILIVYYVYGFYAPGPKRQTYFKIKQLYSLGYLNAFFKVNKLTT